MGTRCEPSLSFLTGGAVAERTLQKRSPRAEQRRLQSASGGRSYTTGRGGGEGRPLPAYLRIVEAVSERLASGYYGPGNRLPSESEFCSEFGVSHMTLRRALTILSDKGLISAEKGRGTFVRWCDLSDTMFSLKELAAGWLDAPLEPRLLSVATIGANSWVARKLAISPGDRVVYLRQLVLRTEVPAIYHWEYMRCDPRSAFVELLLRSASLHGLLQTPAGEAFPRAQVTLRATMLSTRVAKLLDRPPRTPALRIEHLFEDTECRPLSWGCLLLRADMATFHASLGPTPACSPQASGATSPAPRSRSRRRG